ncbi:MAG: TonB family protein, partial [Polyangia bacterium]
DIGTIGHGSGTGTGYGYGGGVGGLGGRRASMPVCTLGLAETRGSCDKDLIRRVVRAHVNELRFCYERALQSRPELAGRVVSRFTIGFDGRVSSSTIASSTIAAGVDSCVAQAIARWQFVPRCVGAVSYPFVFESATRSAP